MNKRLIVLAAVLFGFFPVSVSAQSGNFRLLLHGTKQVSEGLDEMYWAGWVVAPNATSKPNKWLILTGPRLEGKNWWSEFNFGAFVEDGEAQTAVDIRTNWPFWRPFSLWTNFTVYDDGEGESIYFYGEVDHLWPSGFAVGLETENNFPNKSSNDMSFGPHVKFPMGHAAAIHAIYQFHNGEDQLWFRLVMNLR
jgi:hypothetical protein